MISGYNRQKIAVSLIRHPFKSVLDLGCGRNTPLREYLPKDIKYCGIDNEKGQNIKVWSMEEGLPFLKNNSYDVVFAIEVLEHLENIHFVFEEIKRVAKNEIVIALPNMNHWIYRIRHLLRHEILLKYKLYKNTDEWTSKWKQGPKDRHRWFTIRKQSIEFVRTNAKEYKIEIGHHFYPYKRLKFLKVIDKFLSKIFPELFVYTIYFHLEK